MPGPSRTAPDSRPTQGAGLDRTGLDRTSRSADRVYHAVTIAAILLVICSLWVF
jgi:hypothetical protein